MRTSSSSLFSLWGLASQLVLASDSVKETFTQGEEGVLKKDNSVGNSKGCEAKEFQFVAQPGGESKRLQFDGDRFFRISIPRDYKAGAPVPLILAFHDFNMTAKDMEDTTLLSHPSYNTQAVVVYPEASEETRWMADSLPPRGINDIGFVEALLNRLSEKLCIDQDRIYATGLGTGGGMTHLLACSDLAQRIAAFSLVNANIFQGLQGDGAKQIKDPLSLMWKKCDPKRIPVPMQIIHTENNTLYDYWGENKVDSKARSGTVMHLVSWATRNACGPAVGLPGMWRGNKDDIHKTMLQQGYIFEGFIEDGAVVKATYHCWPGDMSKQQEDAAKSVADGEEVVQTKEEENKEDAPKDSRTEEEKRQDFISVIRTNQIHEHYFVRGLDHGWPRVEMIATEEWTAWKEKGEPISLSKPAPKWRNITEAPSIPLNIDLTKNETTFDYGYMVEFKEEDVPKFDTTERLLKFLRLYRLSDPKPKAPRNFDGLTEAEAKMLEDMVGQITSALKEKKGELDDSGDSVPAQMKEELKEQEENLDKEEDKATFDDGRTKSDTEKLMSGEEPSKEAPKKDHDKDEL